MSKRSATLPDGWTISAFAAHDAPGDLWICINTPDRGDFLRLCKKQNEIYIAVELMKHADGAQRPALAMEARPGMASVEAVKKAVREYATFYADYRAECGFENQADNFAKLDALDAQIDALSAAAEAPQPWRNIATAPKDERVLLFVPAFGPWVASWWPGSWAWAREQWAIHTPFSGSGDRAIFGTDGPTPTHWMPLPQPPSLAMDAAPATANPAERRAYIASRLPDPEDERD